MVKKLYNRFTMYQSFAPDMPYRGDAGKLRGSAKCVPGYFL
ncbi:MAG: hypothetical protein ACLTER_05785 [Ruminococcus sp.]